MTKHEERMELYMETLIVLISMGIVTRSTGYAGEQEAQSAKENAFKRLAYFGKKREEEKSDHLSELQDIMSPNLPGYKGGPITFNECTEGANNHD